MDWINHPYDLPKWVTDVDFVSLFFFRNGGLQLSELCPLIH